MLKDLLLGIGLLLFSLTTLIFRDKISDFPKIRDTSFFTKKKTKDKITIMAIGLIVVAIMIVLHSISRLLK